jgi:general secretion pathway protein A
MEYFRILNLIKEPFSNSPEPEFFYQSPQHVECLQKLELAVRLHRGLNVVIGDVGTGKTTLCRQLIRKFADDKEIESHLLLDPHFSKPIEFLRAIAEMFTGEKYEIHGVTEWQLREKIKKYLFDRCISNRKLIVLIVDEGQKVPDFCIEIMREFLNYETNEHKLLQIVIFAQREFGQMLRQHRGFADRINVQYDLGPLNFKDSKSMIRFRLEKASEAGRSNVEFSYPALRAIYKATEGYPRKIVSLCHQIILALIIQNKTRAGWRLVRSCVYRNAPEIPKRISWANVGVLAGLLVILFFVIATPDMVGTFDIMKSMSLETPISSQALSYSPEVVDTENNAAVTASRETNKLNKEAQEEFSYEKETLIAGDGTMETGNVLHADGAGATFTHDEEADEIMSEFQEEKIVPDIRYPEILGQLTIEKKNIIWFMIQDVYGVCDARHLKLVSEVNPHIRNLNSVFAGDRINFPSITAESEMRSNYCTVQIEEKGNLHEAYALLKSSDMNNLPDLSLLSYWTSQGGLRFALVLKERFSDELSARKAIDKLPLTLSSKTKVIKGWKKGTVFFTDTII